MRAANITTGFATALWLALFLIGRSGTYAIYSQGPGISPNAGQIDFYIVFPMLVLALLTFAGWLCNIFRWSSPLLTLSILACAALLPFLFIYGGGV